MDARDERPGTADRAVYVISVAAELTGVHPQTLRVYERRGLVEPARTDGMSRRYSESDIERVRRITELTEEGLNLAGVKRVLELEAEVTDLRARLRAAGTPGSSRPPTSPTDLVPVGQEIVVWRRRRSSR
ncbi:MAG: helix-turn-helix transcriptional regulator [Acidimicrobiales bacterium]